MTLASMRDLAASHFYVHCHWQFGNLFQPLTRKRFRGMAGRLVDMF
jgi:hypothetical protein